MAPVRLYLDEDVWEGLAEVLRNAGYDVISAREAGRKGFDDASQLIYASAQGRALLTHNVRDFVVFVNAYAVQGRKHAGIIVAPQVGKGELLRRTAALLNSFTAEEIEDTLQFL